MIERRNYNQNYIHHRNPFTASIMRELVFGIEDGMVSTMGAITGIAAGTGNYFFVILSGLVIISVESISMAVGSYLSSKSGKEIDVRKLVEEKEEIKNHPQDEQDELIDLFIKDGWPKNIAKQMADVASGDKNLMLKEMAYRELYLAPDNSTSPFRNGFVMLFSYILGGIIPVLPYFFVDIFVAIPISVGITLSGLFILGSFTTKYSKRKWWKAGLEMLGLASLAALVGYGVGNIVDRFFLN